MAKHLIITLEYDMGDYSDMEEDGQKIPTDPKDIGLNESFFKVMHKSMIWKLSQLE